MVYNMIGNKSQDFMNVVFKVRLTNCHFHSVLQNEPVIPWISYIVMSVERLGHSPQEGEYFVIFVDDCTYYVQVYILKYKSEVFKKFREWKAMVEKSSGLKVRHFILTIGGIYFNLSVILFFIGRRGTANSCLMFSCVK